MEAVGIAVIALVSVAFWCMLKAAAETDREMEKIWEEHNSRSPKGPEDDGKAGEENYPGIKK